MSVILFCRLSAIYLKLFRADGGNGIAKSETCWSMNEKQVARNRNGKSKLIYFKRCLKSKQLQGQRISLYRYSLGWLKSCEKTATWSSSFQFTRRAQLHNFVPLQWTRQSILNRGVLCYQEISTVIFPTEKPNEKCERRTVVVVVDERTTV